MGGIGKLVMKMKGLKADAHDVMDMKKQTGAVVDAAAVDAAKEDSTSHVHDCAVA